METDVTRNIEEQLSAFLDGELAEAELQLLVRRLEREPAYRDTLARYAAIGAVMRGEPVAVAPGSSLSSFRSDLLDKVEADGDATESVASFEATDPRRGSRRAVSGALAASVALIAAFGVYQGGYLADPVETAAVAPVSAPVARQVQVSAPVPRSARPGLARSRATITPDRMTSYMVSHGEFSRTYHGPMVDSRVFVQPARFDER